LDRNELIKLKKWEEFNMSKVSYIQLLKEAISEYDAKAMDYKGPLSEPILTFRGDGEIETHKDASSILERYYFNENQEKLVEQQDEIGPENPLEFSDDEDAEDPNEIVTGEESDDVGDTIEDLEDEILGEGDDLENGEEKEGEDEDAENNSVEEDLELEDYDPEDPDIVAKDEPLEDEKAAPMNNEMVALENTVIEKLIQEMENEVPREDEPGTEAGTDLVDDDEAEKTLNDDLDLLEAELADEADEMEDEEGEKDLDVDKEIGDEEPVKKENKRLGPINPGSDHEILDEAFQIFQEAIDQEDESEDEEPEDEEEKTVEEDLELEDLELEDYDPEDPDIVAKDEPLDADEKASVSSEAISLLEDSILEEDDGEEKAEEGEEGEEGEGEKEED